MAFTVALSGDSIITSRISAVTDERFLRLVGIFRGADISFTHLETLIHDFDGPEVYPAAEAGWGWMRSPRVVADDLRWAGFDVVSLASNHSFDYSYGALFSTWKALEEAGIPHAGTGRSLGEARAPVYVETSAGRVALISMTSSFAMCSRAGDVRRDVKGRPGVNPLRYHHEVDSETIKMITGLAMKLGWWVTRVGDREWLVNPPGLHNTLYRYVEADVDGVTTVADEEDVEGNIRSIREARQQAEFVIVHVHSHEWDPERDLSVPARFLPPFARSCIDAGADVFVAEGSHAPLRGIEIYESRPIFYDPGDLFRLSDTITRWPADLYARHRYGLGRPPWDATPSEGIAALRSPGARILNPPGGYLPAPVRGFVVPVCVYDYGFHLTRIELHPGVWAEKPRSRRGLALAATQEEAERIIDYLCDLCAPYGTAITPVDGMAKIDIQAT